MAGRLRVRVLDPGAAAREVAGEIAALIRERAAEGRSCVLGLASGRSPLGVYAELARLQREEGLSFEGVHAVNLDEYEDVDPSDPRSFGAWMRAHLLDAVGLPPERTLIPPPDLAPFAEHSWCRELERRLQGLGGIDLQLLGLGRNGHIGFNEPGSARDSAHTAWSRWPGHARGRRGRAGRPGELSPPMPSPWGRHHPGGAPAAAAGLRRAQARGRAPDPRGARRPARPLDLTCASTRRPPVRRTRPRRVAAERSAEPAAPGRRPRGVPGQGGGRGGAPAARGGRHEELDARARAGAGRAAGRRARPAVRTGADPAGAGRAEAAGLRRGSRRARRSGRRAGARQVREQARPGAVGGELVRRCVKLHELSRSDAGIARKLLYEYEVVRVDVGRFDKNVELAEELGADFKSHGLPFLTVLDADGRALVQQETSALEVPGRATTRPRCWPSSSSTRRPIWTRAPALRRCPGRGPQAGQAAVRPHRRSVVRVVSTGWRPGWSPTTSTRCWPRTS